MKLRRTLSGVLFGVGCAMAFVGLLALILPAVANDQLQLVLASFAIPADQPLVGLVNACMSFALANGWQVLLAGTVMLTIGVTLFSRYTPQEEVREWRQRPASAAAEPLWEQPEPARTGPNPFAETALWEQYAPKIQPVPEEETPKIGFGAPLLEPNRVEETVTAAPVQAYARPAPQPQPQIEPKQEAVPQIELEQEAAPESQADDECPLPEEIAAQEIPVQPENSPQSGKPVQISPRIRSTVGKRREW